MLLIIVLLSVFGNTLAREQVLAIPDVDHILDRLAKQNWDADEVFCRKRIFDILENVKNSTLWATWVWNSIDQSPTGIFFGARYHLGNYDQCLRPLWLQTHPELRTQYCLAEIEMNKHGGKSTKEVSDPYVKAEEYYLNLRTAFGRSFSYTAHGICLPAGCPSKSVKRFTETLLSTGHLVAARNASVSIHHCDEAGALREYSTGYYVFMCTFAALLFIAVASTYYVCECPVAAGSNSFMNHVAKSFCVRRNLDAVFKTDKDDLRCLHGIRFLTAAIIVYVHSLAVMQGTSISNAIDFERLATDNPLFSALSLHFDVIVDTFFAMSALLFGRSLATLDVTKPENIMKMILKRYIRLIVPLAVTAFYLAHVLKHVDDGPVYPVIALVEQQACEKNWWLALLMVGNYFNTSEMCHPATWYVPCDFHFHVITLLLLYMYHRNARAGKIAAAILMAIGFTAPAISTYVFDLPAVIGYDLGPDVNIRKNKAFNNMYIRTHNRMGPFVAGLAVGYFMSIYKPRNYRRVWSKTVSFLGANFSLVLMLAVLVLGKLCYVNAIHGPLACIYTTFDRTVFAIAVLGVIVFCTYGDVPLINSFLSWSLFAPVSRLSYGVYVIHLLFLYQASSIRSHKKNHLFEVLTSALGLLVVSLVLSLAVWLLAEAPLANITNRYLNTKTVTNEKFEVSREKHPYDTNKQKIK